MSTSALALGGSGSAIALWVALAGGWPGALVAQQQFRRKTIKQAFQSVFWVTVVMNVAAVAWLVRSGIASALSQWLSG